MTYITTSLTIIITLWGVNGTPFHYPNTFIREYTDYVPIRQGNVRGVVAVFQSNRKLPPVVQYKGIPYAMPPVGKMRFMPSGSAFPISNMTADNFGPVCPQKFPDTRTMTPERREEFLNLYQYLQNEDEDCLYLNIYTPYQEKGKAYSRGYPVMVFIHGESFEWNSGNPYDGSVLAAYGKVIVVTLNYRLGVLGFLKTGTEESRNEQFESNFGLVDQIAALLWVKENIAAFGGDPNTVTLFGHGTGAVCASLLMLSPMIVHENKRLFQRAILMGGSALSDWALAGNPRDVSYQVAQALNCQIHDDFAACLRKKRLDEIMAASPETPSYRTRFGPVVDGVVVPNDPKKLMTTYSDIFKGFELMYGVTELESIYLLRPDALKLGMLEKDRDQELRKYMRFRCEMKSELCFIKTLKEYTSVSEFVPLDEGYTGHEPDRASLYRDGLLDILSDARTVAPMVQMAKYHALLNQQSYFYVFTHKTESKEHLRNKSSTGDELPYVFGVPLGGSRFHFTDHYNEKERLFSEIIMTYFCNFAYTGDPNMPRKSEYNTLGLDHWIKYEADWPEFDLKQQQYLQLGLPSYRYHHYRDEKMRYWNEIFPVIAYNYTSDMSLGKPIKTNRFFPSKNPLPWVTADLPKRGTYTNKFENFSKPWIPRRGTSTEHDTYGVVRIAGPSPPDNIKSKEVHYGKVLNSPESDDKGISSTLAISLGSLFLIFNVCILLVFYYLRRCRKMKERNIVHKNEEPSATEEDPDQAKLLDGCNIMKIVSKSSRSDDTYEAVKSSGSTRKLKLPRQMSSSTIDAHTKVRDWITNEIVYKYSPRFLRRPRQSNESKSSETKTKTSPPMDNNSTLGRSPTRPVSPSDNYKAQRPPLIKSSSIPVQKTKKIEKVSVAIDATPSGRGNSVLAQQPIELTKSLDRPNFEVPLRRSLTLDDFSVINPTNTSKQELRKSTTSINLKFSPPDVPTVIRIDHAHSKSDPVQDMCYYSNPKKLKTFDPQADVNVTSCDDIVEKVPLTPEESLMTIKRRNFPKVLPDYPTREALAKKRRSMPVANHLFSAIPEIPGQPQPHSPTNKTFGKLPPAPPLRTTSTLTRKGTIQSPPVCQSSPMLAQEPPSSPEPEVTCNNLYVGPLIPKMVKNDLSSSESSKLNTQPIYESLRAYNSESEKKVAVKPVAKTIITADPEHPIKKIEPKVIIKPTMSRSLSDPKKNIPRVMVHDNIPEEDKGKKIKPSQIPTLVKGSKESSSSESTPSEESDTGTVVKRM